MARWCLGRGPRIGGLPALSDGPASTKMSGDRLHDRAARGTASIRRRRRTMTRPVGGITGPEAISICPDAPCKEVRAADVRTSVERDPGGRRRRASDWRHVRSRSHPAGREPRTSAPTRRPKAPSDSREGARIGRPRSDDRTRDRDRTRGEPGGVSRLHAHTRGEAPAGLDRRASSWAWSRGWIWSASSSERMRRSLRRPQRSYSVRCRSRERSCGSRSPRAS